MGLPAHRTSKVGGQNALSWSNLGVHWWVWSGLTSTTHGVLISINCKTGPQKKGHYVIKKLSQALRVALDPEGATKAHQIDLSLYDLKAHLLRPINYDRHALFGGSSGIYQRITEFQDKITNCFHLK